MWIDEVKYKVKVSDYIANKLTELGVTDAFGIPGGVILRLLYSIESHPNIRPHLMLHEQTAGFAACGYAQASGKLGVAYATRGPGITNMMTCIAEAYQESLPVLFITAHGTRTQTETRFENSQEFDIVKSVLDITKYAVTIDDINQIQREFEKACSIAMEGRRGPVLVDILSSIFNREIEVSKSINEHRKTNESDAGYEIIIKSILEKMKYAKRPILLIGDGIRHTFDKESIYLFAKLCQLPILSSRGAQDILCFSEYYYGYIGSHGTRYSNFIVSKADLIIVLGNRIGVPLKSQSYSPIIKNATIIRIDIDEREFKRQIPTAENYKADAGEFIRYIVDKRQSISASKDWIKICNLLKMELNEFDRPFPVKVLENFLKKQVSEKIYVCDVGNNEFFAARAFEMVHPSGTILCSKSYGTLGVGLARAIGAYYATQKEIVCIIGDQGMQYNIQDLHYIVSHCLPIKVLVLNDRTSGMIADHEKQIFGTNLVHVDNKTDYYVPDLKKVANAYGMQYIDEYDFANDNGEKNLLYEIKYSYSALIPNLPKGNKCQDMEPLLDRHKYEYLNNL